MKGRKWSFILCVVLGIGLLSGCGTASKQEPADQTEPPVTEQVQQEETDPEKETQLEDTETEKETQLEEVDTAGEAENAKETPDDAGFTFEEIDGMYFWFASGVGGWSTDLILHGDGSFEGVYHDSDMGNTGEGYPDGTMYYCDFKGTFSSLAQVNEYTYSTRIKSMELANEPGKEEIIDEMNYVYSEPYGLDQAEDIYIYLPGAPIDQLPEGYRSWANMALSEVTDNKLPFYGIYNVAMEEGFVGQMLQTQDNSAPNADVLQDTGLDKELAATEEKAAELEDRINQESLDQNTLNQLTGELYTLWDNQLNSIWKVLKNTLDEDTMAEVTREEREWIKQKEQEIKDAGAEWEGGSGQPMVENSTGAELTRTRVYELLQYLKK